MKTITSNYPKIIIILVITSIVSIQSLYGQFYQKYSMDQRKKLAEAYYLVGRQYETMHKANAGEYVQMAYRIYPQLNPAEISADEEQTGLISELTTEDVTFQNSIKLVKYRFQRLVAFFLAKDVSSVANYLDNLVYNGDFDLMLTKEEITTELSLVYDFIRTTDIAPESLYKINEMVVTAVPGTQTTGTVFELTVEAKNMDYNRYFSFWHEKQKFYWHQDTEEKWVIFAISSLPPAELYTTYSQEVQTKKAVIRDFKACLQAFITEDLAGVSPYLAEQVLLIPLNTTLEKSEIEYTFTGYFEETAGYSSGNVDDLLERISANSDQVYTAAQGTSVYLVQIELKTEDSPEISFWAAYTKYYLKKIDSRWKIIAIG